MEHRLEFPLGTVIYQSKNYITHLRASPRGDLLAFIEHPVGAPGSVGWVIVMDRSGRKMLQSSGWPDLWGVAWRPDGREVWFTAADRREYKSLRAITLDGHERVGRGCSDRSRCMTSPEMGRC